MNVSKQKQQSQSFIKDGEITQKTWKINYSICCVNKISKITHPGNDAGFLHTHHTKYKLVFCCNVLKNRFLMVSPCQTELYLIVFYNNKKSLHKGCHKMKGQVQSSVQEWFHKLYKITLGKIIRKDNFYFPKQHGHTQET